MSDVLEKKKCVVLGGCSDIGKAIIAALRNEYDIVATYWNTKPDQLNQDGLEYFRYDLREPSPGGIEQFFHYHVGDKIDMLVTSAFPFLECDNLDFQGYVAAEKFLRAHVLAVTLAAKKMNPGGKIFHMLGQCVERGLPGGAFYSASFALLHNWSNSINGKEGKAGKFSVCDLLLGPVDTREWNGLSKEVVDRYKAKVSQFISPKQVGETVKFLASQKVLPSTYKLDAYYGN